MYTPKHKPNQVITGTGSVVIVTGWTIKKRVSEKLEPHQYACIGNLYSRRGLNFLIANILANPFVSHIALLNATKYDENSGSVQCLFDFMENGVSRGFDDYGGECWVVKSKISGFIEGTFKQEQLNQIRNNVKCFVRTSTTELAEAVKGITTDGCCKKWAEPVQINFEQKNFLNLPGKIYGHCVEGKTIAETWLKIIHLIKTTGVIRPTGYDGKWQELINLMSVISDEPEDYYFPTPNYLPCDRESLENYVPTILEDSEYSKDVKYTYGQRIRSWFGVDQIELVVKKLIGEIDAASAVINLWDTNDHVTGGSPCLNHIWVRVVDSKLSLTATIRSNDMFSAWVLNAMGLRVLQKHILDRINSESDYNLLLGHLIIISQSAHIYDDCWEEADRLIKKYYIGKRKDYDDPCGNFVITIEDSIIKVEQTDPKTGQLVYTYTGKRANTIIEQITKNSPFIEAEHSMYLGCELTKAELSIIHPTILSYTQDRLTR